MTIATLAGILAQTPAGAFIDATRAKRLAMAAAAALVTLASLLLPLFPGFLPVAISQGLAHAAGSIFPPALAAVSLGIVGHRAFTKRIGRNEAFNHAGNATAAIIAGASAYLWGPKVVFYLLGAMSLASIASVWSIPERAIDRRASPSSWRRWRSWPSPFASRCFISRTPPCCRWSARSLHLKTRTLAPA